MKYIKEGTEFLDQLKDSVHDLYNENKELKKEIERLNAIIDKLNEKGKFLTDVANEKQNRIDRAMAYNNFILKEEWYGGNEKKYAQRNIDILLGKETELKELPRLGVDKE